MRALSRAMQMHLFVCVFVCLVVPERGKLWVGGGNLRPPFAALLGGTDAEPSPRSERTRSAHLEAHPVGEDLGDRAQRLVARQAVGELEAAPARPRAPRGRARRVNVRARGEAQVAHARARVDERRGQLRVDSAAAQPEAHQATQRDAVKARGAICTQPTQVKLCEMRAAA